MATAIALSPLIEQHTIAAKKTERLKLADLAKRIQVRKAMDTDAIDRYAALYTSDGADALPPIVVFTDGDQYVVADGCHRCAAAEQAGLKSLLAIVKKGDHRDAILFAAGANTEHGVTLTNADKRRVIEIVLADPEWVKWSDREIARRCHTSHTLVSTIRPTVNGAQTTKRKSADGRERDVSKIGKGKSKLITDDPATVNTRRKCIAKAERLVASNLRDWSNPVKAMIGAILHYHGAVARDDGSAPSAYAMDIGRVAEIANQHLDIHPGQLRRTGLVIIDANEVGVKQMYLTPAAAARLDECFTDDAAPDIELPDDHQTPPSKPAATKAKLAPLADRRLDWIRHTLADKLDAGKIGSVGTAEACALVLITGIEDGTERYSVDLVERGGYLLAEAVAKEVAYHLRERSNKLSQLPTLPDLCRIFHADYDSLAAQAAATVTE